MRALTTEEVQEVSGALTYAAYPGYNNWKEVPDGFRWPTTTSVSYHDGATWVLGTPQVA